MKLTRVIIEKAIPRFNKYVTKSDGCWPWSGSRRGRGYGNFGIKRGSIGAHRFAWMAVNGPVPDGMCVCHRCDNPPCCNPAHLFLGTLLDNINDRDEKRRQWNMKKTHCIHGHQLTPENVKLDRDGHRGCKTCDLIRKKAYRRMA